MEPVLVIAGIACMLYGLAIMAVRSGTWFFAFWLVLGALLLGGAWAVHAGAWEALPAAARHAVRVAAAVLVAGFLATQVLILKDFGDRAEDGVDYVVVLGAQVREDGPSAVLAFRLETAFDYLERNEGARCIVSGGQGANEPSTEASVMASYLVARGIDPDRIIVEDRSRSTAENIANCRALVDARADRIGVVTNDFHLFRSLAIARKAGLERVSGIAAPSSPFYLPNNMARESLGIAKDFLTGNL